MEQRKGKVIIHSSGGTATKGSNTYKLTLPSVWMKEMGISEQDREVELFFDGNTISISKHLEPSQLIVDKIANGDSFKKISYYDGNTCCTTIYIDMDARILRVKNHTNNLTKTAFGKNLTPTWDDLEQFLEERCIPRQRAGLREYLEAIGVDEYDPWRIIEKTEGRMAEDDQWIKIEVIG